MSALPETIISENKPTVRSLQVVTGSTSFHLAKLDRVGAGLSFACAIHCLCLPFVLTLLPVAGLSFLADSVFEISALVAALLFSSISLWWGHRVHRQTSLFWFLGIGAALFLLAHGVAFQGEAGGDHHVGGSENLLHAIMMGFGGLSLAVGHVVNRRLCRTCHEGCCDAG